MEKLIAAERTYFCGCCMLGGLAFALFIHGFFLNTGGGGRSAGGVVIIIIIIFIPPPPPLFLPFLSFRINRFCLESGLAGWKV